MTTSLADRIAASAPQARKLTLSEWLLSLGPEDRAAAEAMASNRDWTNAGIIEFLASENVGVGKDGVSAWRNRVSR